MQDIRITQIEILDELREIQRKLQEDKDSSLPIWCQWCKESRHNKPCKCFRLEVKP